MWLFVKIEIVSGGEKCKSKAKSCIGGILDADLSRQISKSLDKSGLLKGEIQDLMPKAD